MRAVASRKPSSRRAAIRSRRSSAPSTSLAASSRQPDSVSHGLEQGGLVLLQIAVVGQRQVFHEEQHLRQGPHDAGRLAADQFEHVGIPLLRHDRRAGRQGVGQLEETELGREPQNPLLRPAAQMQRDEREAEEELDEEVAVVRDVEAVGGRTGEPKQLGREGAVDRKRRAGQGTGSQRRNVDPLEAVGQPGPIALELLAVREPIVDRHHRLGTLQMRVARQDHVEVAITAGDEGTAAGFRAGRRCARSRPG